MKLKERKKSVWCLSCKKKVPIVLRDADWLIPVRLSHYALDRDGLNIDKRVCGVCDECLKTKNKFQQKNKEAVVPDHAFLVKRYLKGTYE